MSDAESADRAKNSVWSPEVLVIGTPAFDDVLVRLFERGHRDTDAGIAVEAREVVESVRRGGDIALLDAVKRFDGVEASSVSDLRVDLHADQSGDQGRDRSEPETAVDPAFDRALERSIAAVTRFHDPQRRWLENGYVVESPGSRLEERVFPLRRVGLYVPGGRFAYPSTVIMSVIPARLAGVEEIVVATPPGALARCPELRRVLERLGVGEIWGMGGAQAIAALAYGTETILPVELVAGPGNAWVTAAKRLVRGVVAVDQDAGPSEVVIIATEGAPAAWVAADLLAQAEHDPRAMAVLVTPSVDLAREVASEIASQLPGLATRETATSALRNFGAILVTDTLERAWGIAEDLAAEHQQLMGQEAESLEPRVRNAGALFVGSYTPTCFGDYAAGPSHVLPTGGSARYSSGLSVLDFTRRSHRVWFSEGAAAEVAATASCLAAVEGLVGHRRSAELRSGPMSEGSDEGSST